MREFAEPLVTLLRSYQARANHSGQPVTIPWADINNIITPNSPAIDYDAFDKQYTGEQSQSLGALNNIVNSDRDSYDQNGIRLMPDNQPAELATDQEAVDTSHSIVKQTAMSQLKRSK